MSWKPLPTCWAVHSRHVPLRRLPPPCAAGEQLGSSSCCRSVARCSLACPRRRPLGGGRAPWELKVGHVVVTGLAKGGEGAHRRRLPLDLRCEGCEPCQACTRHRKAGM